MTEALTTRALPRPVFRYSQIRQAGSHYYCSGLIALDDDGKLVAGGAGAEAASILSRLPALLEELDMDWSNLVFVRIFCADFSRFAEVNHAWEEVFTPDITPPARSAVGVSDLPKGATVEIELVLYREG